MDLKTFNECLITHSFTITLKEFHQTNSSVEIHIKAAREKRLATLEEFDKKRYMVVGDLAIKTVE